MREHRYIARIAQKDRHKVGAFKISRGRKVKIRSTMNLVRGRSPGSQRILDEATDEAPEELTSEPFPGEGSPEEL